MRRGGTTLLLSAATAVSVLSIAGCGGRKATKPMPPASAAQRDDTSRPQSSRYAQGADSTPSGPPPDVSKIPEPVPRVEPRSAYGNKSPYDVLGKTYRVLPEASGYVERGLASWYGNKFHGYTTSNFEKYDMYAFSAAHKTLPLPSYARVTNLDNGRSVIVRVNDRGPFVDDRIIDLSYVAAVKLGVWPKGTARVEVRAIDPAHPQREAPTQTIPASALSRTALPPSAVGASPAPGKTHESALYLQVGAYTDPANAAHAATVLRGAQLGDVQVIEGRVNGNPVRRVRIGPLRNAEEADALTSKVRALGLGEPHLVSDD